VASRFEAWTTDGPIRAALAADEAGRWERIPVLRARNDDPAVLRAAQAPRLSADPAERRGDWRAGGISADGLSAEGDR
jgi:hypothetical protein